MKISTVLQIQKEESIMKQLILKPNIALSVPEFPPVHHKTDTDKIIALCNRRGCKISFAHARQVWNEHSDFWDASWLNTIDTISDDEIFAIVKQYTDVKRFKDSVIETLFDTYLQTLPAPIQDNIKASEKRGESLTAKTFEHAFLLGQEHSTKVEVKQNPNFKLGSWLEVQTLDEMEAFYISRLSAIREAAGTHGYAIGVHGSMRRDLDLMAMPWSAYTSDKDALARALAMAACGITREGPYQWETKPSNRFAVSIPICVTNCSNVDFDKPSIGHIDLSVIEI